MKFLTGLSGKAWAWLGIGAVIVALSLALHLTRGALARQTVQTAAERIAHVQTIRNYQAAAAARKASDQANVVRVDGEATAISKETMDDYQARIDRLRADFAERVRLATAADPGGAGRANLPEVPGPTGPADDAPGHPELPARLALIASEQAEQLVALQAWVRRTAAIDTNGN